MILRVDLTVPGPEAYIVAAQRIPSDWIICSQSNLADFATRNPGWDYYTTGGLRSSWLGGMHLIREAEISRT